MVLALPEQWLAQEERARWMTRTAEAAAALYEMLDENGRPRTLATSINHLAGELGAELELIRDGIEGLWCAGGVALERHGGTINVRDLQRLADHARFTMLLDWSVLDDHWAPANDAEWPPGEVRWNGSPWACVRGVLRNPELSREAAQLMASLGFTLRQPTGECSTASIAEFAAEECLHRR